MIWGYVEMEGYPNLWKKYEIPHHDMEWGSKLKTTLCVFLFNFPIFVLSWAIWGSWPRSSGLKPPSDWDSIPKKMILRRKNIFPPAMQHYYLLLDLPIKNRHSYIMVYTNFPMFLLCVSYFAQKMLHEHPKIWVCLKMLCTPKPNG